MSLFSRIIVGVVAVVSMVTISMGADLLPGSPAPKIEVKTWVKGTPVTEFAKDKLYVVEFWATWCGPCKQSIPHLTELAHKNKDVTFVGVSIWEDETPVAPFVKEMGDKMDYNVAYSGNKDGMAVSWMEAAGQNGIPSAFIVKEGKVVWIGHPMSLEKPLEEVKAGTFDVEAARKEIEAQVAQAKAAREIKKKLAAVEKTHKEGKIKEANAELDSLIKENPQIAPQAEPIRNRWLALDDPAACEKKIESLVKTQTPNSRQQLLSLAMVLMQEKQAKALAKKAAIGAVEGLNDSDKQFTITNYQVAYVLHTLSEDKAALPYAEKAVAGLPTSPFKDSKDAIAVISKLRDDIKKAAG